MGHKDLPLISRFPGMNWYRISTPEVMHDCKIFCEMLLKCLIGNGLGVMEDLQGGYKWSKDATHRAEAKSLGIFRDIWPDRGGPLPWRLTKEQIRQLDDRMKRTVWPHHMDRMFYDGCSFWVKPGRIWKTRRKVCLHN